MPSLAELQQSFLENIFQKPSSDLSFIASPFAKERFKIYSQTILENLIHSLKVTYPGIWILLGDECANTVAHHYCTYRYFLPKTGYLDDFGAQFPNFISTLEELSSIPYLKDYAYYEWLIHLAYTKSNSLTISSYDFQNISEDELNNIQFRFIPACFLLSSQYPLDDIHDIVKGYSQEEIQLEKKWVYAVIARFENEIRTYWITKEIWMFLKQLKKKKTLWEATEYTEGNLGEFDLTSAITFILKTQIIQNFI